MKKYTTALVLLTLLSGCSFIQSFKAKNDLKTLCAHATAFDWKKSNDKAQLTTEFHQGVDKKISSGSVSMMLDSVSSASQNQRWQLFKMGATELGVEDYQCPPLQSFLQGDWSKLNSAIVEGAGGAEPGPRKM